MAKLVFIGFVQIGCVMGMAWQSHKILQLLLKNQMELSTKHLTILLLLATCSAAIRWYERFLAEKLGQNYVHDVRLLLFDTLTKHKDVSQKRNGIHMVRFSNDLTAIRQWVSVGIAQFVSLCLFFCGVILALSLLDVAFAGIVGTGFGISVLCILLLGYGLEKSIRDSRAKRGKLANCINEIINIVPHLSLFGRTHFERERLSSQSQNLAAALTHRAVWLGSLTGLSEFCISAIAIAVLILGVSSFNEGSIGLPTLMAIFGIAALVATPLREFSRIFEYRKNYVVASGIILRFINDTRPSKAAGQNRYEASANCDFNGSIGFDRVQVNGMDIANVQIPSGKRIAVVGRNGSGKTLLLKTIAGMYPPQAGEIALDDIPTLELDEHVRKSYIGIASHDLPLTQGSISKNIRYRNPRASRYLVNAAIESADLLGWLDTLPRGLDTRLGGRGHGLSEGQAARVKLARAILGKPPVLILDEIERSLDEEGKAALYALLLEYPGTVIYSTDDKVMLDHADAIWSLSPGELSVHLKVHEEGATNDSTN